ncbi:MAG: carboxypeptidase-like regulatory domain-containing protein [Acidobacteriota bacterium]
MNVAGKSLTEVTLRVRNHAQRFVKVDLPQGATLLSAEVEGEKVKPVQGADGSRVPLLRAGFRPSGAYTVSFVYLNSGAAFAKNGSYEMNLPKLDIPISILTWEVFLPDRLEVRQFGGNALAASLFLSDSQGDLAIGIEGTEGDLKDLVPSSSGDAGEFRPGQIGGIVVDLNGAVIRNAVVTVVNSQTGAALTTRTNDEGRWVVSSVRPGPVRVKVDSPGFATFQQEMDFDSSRSAHLGVTLNPSGAGETVNVTASRDEVQTSSSNLNVGRKNLASGLGNNIGLGANAPSQNVFNLQKRVAGVLPVRVDVPRAGKSYRFVRPLVLEEETKISFQYKTR